MYPEGLRCFSLPAAAAAPACCFETHLHPNSIRHAATCVVLSIYSVYFYLSHVMTEPKTTAMMILKVKDVQQRLINAQRAVKGAGVAHCDVPHG